MLLPILKPAPIPRTNKIRVNSKACFGIIASITNDSSPLVAIIAATTAPKETIQWAYIYTIANGPRHPGMAPRKAAKIYCPHL